MKTPKTVIDVAMKAVTRTIKMEVPNTVGGLMFSAGLSMAASFASGYLQGAGLRLQQRIKPIKLTERYKAEESQKEDKEAEKPDGTD